MLSISLWNGKNKAAAILVHLTGCLSLLFLFWTTKTFWMLRNRCYCMPYWKECAVVREKDKGFYSRGFWTITAQRMGVVVNKLQFYVPRWKYNPNHHHVPRSSTTTAAAICAWVKVLQQTAAICAWVKILNNCSSFMCLDQSTATNFSTVFLHQSTTL